MALSEVTNSIWKWLSVQWSVVFDIYWKMFDPVRPYVPDVVYNEYSVHNPTTNFNLSWFQPWNEVCLWLLVVENNTTSDVSGSISGIFQQRDGSDRVDTWENSRWYDTLPWQYTEWGITYTYWRAIWRWAWIDPDEFRPWITQYRFKYNFMWDYFYRTFTASWLSFDDDPHPAWYLWVEWANLCYIPPSIYSGSSDTGYKHIIKTDPGYSWWSWENPWYIWIPNSSSDHHIYFVSEYWNVCRTAESYEWSGGSSPVWSDKSWFIRLTPSTSSRPEQAWYNYLCYIDWGGYKRRMWVWEI